MKAARALVLLFALLLAPAASAVEPDEMLKDPVLESRARELSRHLRCLVCQNQSIDDSAAPLARDLRVLVRERLVAGDSDDKVLAFLTQRYGSFVLLKPPVKPATYLLWFGPFAVLILGGLGLWWIVRKRPKLAAPAPLSADEQKRLQAMLTGDRKR